MLPIVASFSMMLNLRERLAIIRIQADAAIGRSPTGMPKRNLLLTPEELAQTSSVTLHHYNQDAESFWQGTKDHDVSQNRNALIEHLVGEGPFRILDFGCGRNQPQNFGTDKFIMQHDVGLPENFGGF